MKKINWKKLKENLLDVIYPKHIKCIFCGEELNELAHNDTCIECQNKLPFIVHGCPKCGGLIEDNNTGVCDTCKRNIHGYYFDEAKSVFIYMDEVVNLVHNYKLENRKFLSEPMAKYLTERFITWGINVDFITAVPLHENREKQRHFNQSREMAIRVSEAIKIPYIDCLKKVKDNTRQALLDIKDRKDNVTDAYQFIKSFKNVIKDKSILLIDDVFTTGATTNEISKILKKAGAKSVYILTFAHSVLGNFEEVRKKIIKLSNNINHNKKNKNV